MEKLENLISIAKLNNLLYKQDEEGKCDKKKTVCTILAVIGIIAVIAVIAYSIYKYLKPDYLDEFEDEDFEDEDFDEDFLDSEEF
ncbi:MAG: DUF4366 domain-containing protein [Lachnospiraceae bacterium]|nr:DUF4366 domain-containing protein [Lachnospiraceae bacterium]